MDLTYLNKGLQWTDACSPSNWDVFAVGHLIEFACQVSCLAYPFCALLLIEGQTTEWTDEKHSLYLDSLESSFVNQLHSSMGLFGRLSKVKMMELNSFQELAVNAYNSSDEYTVLQDGCWRKRNFGRHQLLSDAAAESRDILENPWICHFKSAGQQHDVTSSDLWNRSVDSSKGIHLRGKRKASHGLATSSKRLSACHPWLQDSVGGITGNAGIIFVALIRFSFFLIFMP
ncbi:hypothetical protein CK203_020526 [Vitis vinifera]|uniref:Uncharacterized protein n=1 Tax=Vitis vinifera TaxID=29760 RepID=A0A438FMH6_VITVI|nr:hypothetical protein CK203_020526 [Vitis vinifera]